MKQNFKDISGQTFYYLTAIKHVRTDPGGAVWLCRCVCGNEREAPGGLLRMGKRKSCGCKTKEILSVARTVNFDCTIPGCGRKAKISQMCDLHYRRVKRHGSTAKPSKKGPYSVRQRLDRGSIRATSGCLEWQRGLTIDGYGLIKIDGRNVATHRAAWIDKNGTPADGLFVCHTCDNRKCIELSHLFLGTAKDNRQDCIRKGRANIASGTRHWNYKDGSYVKAP